MKRIIFGNGLINLISNILIFFKKKKKKKFNIFFEKESTVFPRKSENLNVFKKNFFFFCKIECFLKKI